MVKDCLLDEEVRNCFNRCWQCGWNKTEAQHRNRVFKQNGLTETKNGLKKLIIVRGESEHK